MARKKDHIAPFEIVAGLGKSPSGGDTGTENGSGSKEAAPPEPAEKPRRHVVPSAKPAPSPYQAATASTEVGDPGKLTVSMGHLTAGLVIGGVILLLVGAFVLGRTTASAGDQDGSGTAKVDEKPQRLPGKYYMVIEAMDGATLEDRVRAEHIAWFLDQHGVDASVTKYGYDRRRGPFRQVVLGYKGFPSPEDPAARRFAERMAELGAKYSQDYGGNYDFSPRKYMESTGPWFEVWK